MIRNLIFIALVILVVSPVGRMAPWVSTYQVNLFVKRVVVITPHDQGKATGCIDKTIPEILAPGVWLLDSECMVTFEPNTSEVKV
jgi:hypothetical protein